MQTVAIVTVIALFIVNISVSIVVIRSLNALRATIKRRYGDELKERIVKANGILSRVRSDVLNKNIKAPPKASTVKGAVRVQVGKV